MTVRTEVVPAMSPARGQAADCFILLNRKPLLHLWIVIGIWNIPVRNISSMHLAISMFSISAN